VQGVAVCDPNQSSGDYPQWGDHEFRNSVRRLLNTTSGWDELSPNQPVRLTHSMTATGGTAGREPCQKIVDAYNGTKRRSGTSRGCKAYTDFRELLDKEKDIDAVVVCSTDNLHAAIAVAAMKKGKHVFCQKPMTRTIYEARRMAKVAHEKGVATQVAVMNAASADTQKITEWIASGKIGPVRQVINWSSRPYWPQALDRPKQAERVPDGLDWDLWLGPAHERAFNHAYLPFVWRGWYDFGCGSLGDMGCYSFDTIFRVLKLGAPTSVEASSTERYAETFPAATLINFNFPARGDMPPVRLTWYDGGLKPPRPEGLAEGQSMSDGEREGLMFVGDKGTILCGFSGARPRLLPEEKTEASQPRRRPSGGYSSRVQRDWLDACKGAKTVPAANFEFESVVTEALQLGNLAVRTGKRLLWDHDNLKVTNAAEAEKYIRPERRKGWEL
jgi:predicted dehydrogenase